MTAVELFCGVGGMGLGFEQAGFDVLAAVDLDPIHLAAHQRNFPLCEPLREDVRAIDSSKLLEAAKRGWARRHPHADFAGSVDCLFGGPSCQGFSLIGHRNPRDPRNALLGEFARVVASLRPGWFVLENVPGLLNDRYRAIVDDLRGKLRVAGYRIASPWILNAHDHGVPQRRKRVFLVGARAGHPLPSEPPARNTSVCVADAIDDLSFLGRFQRLYGTDCLNLPDRWLKEMGERQGEYVFHLNQIAKDPYDLCDPRSWDACHLTSVGLTRHCNMVIERFEALRPGEQDPISRLTRLDPKGLSPTLRAGTGPDRGSYTSARPVHHRSARVITVREAARLHGFPDWFGFHATKWHGFRQVGNSVPPPLAKAVASTIISAAGRVPRRRRALLPLGPEDLLAISEAQAADRWG